MCEECEACRICKEEYRIRRWIDAIKRYIYRTVCLVKGHKFKDEQEFEAALILGKEYKAVIMQFCRCGESRFYYKDTGQILTEEELKRWTSVIVFHYANLQTKIFELLPKMPYGSKEDE